MRKTPLIALVSYVASPSGRRKLQQLRHRLDTPANRQRAVQMKDKVAASRRGRKA